MSKMVCLNERNYNIWKSKMKDLLFVKKMHLPIFSETHGYKKQWVEDNVHNHIVNETHARTLWEKLEMPYASKTGNNKLFLLKKLMTFKYEETCSILYHINDFQGILDQLSGMVVNFDDEIQRL